MTLGVNGPYAEIIRIEPGDTAKSHYGVAFDIGTTTVTAELFNLSDGQSLGAKTSYNRQAAFGPDIITRIVYAGKGRGLDELQKAILQTMNLMIGELVKAHEISPNDITCVFCSGNTVMLHLFLGIDPAYIRQSPYLPAVNLYPLTRAFNSGIIVNPKALVYCAPGISAYVGGDISCGVLSSRLYANEGVSLLIDVGTNGEIALGCKEFIVTCAASAGPAFEGSGVGCGMRAASGAIEKVEISGGGDLAFKTISGIKPKGICGSGYISLISELLKSGLLDKNGKFKSGECKFMRDGNCGGSS